MLVRVPLVRISVWDKIKANGHIHLVGDILDGKIPHAQAALVDVVCDKVEEVRSWLTQAKLS
jgi:hypothetical protein